jgi:hypothetical protein
MLLSTVSHKNEKGPVKMKWGYVWRTRETKRFIVKWEWQFIMIYKTTRASSQKEKLQGLEKYSLYSFFIVADNFLVYVWSFVLFKIFI